MKLARAFSVLRNRYNPKFRILKYDPLFTRILPASNPKVSVVPILEQWVKEERGIELNQLRNIIQRLRKFRRFEHALQISQWMSGKSCLDLSSTDFALHLDLISKVHGVEQAEEYFNNIPIPSKDFQTYGALLTSYADAKLLEKAEGVMQIMRDLSGNKTMSYNVTLKLYSQLGKYDKIDSLLQQMEENGIEMNIYAYSTILKAYADASDIGRMQKLLTKMETDSLVTMDWTAYSIAAKGYLQAGDIVMAVASLEKFEQLVTGAPRKYACQLLMTMYAGMGRKDEVYRIWNLYQKNHKICNTSYLCMMSSLVKLDDLDGAQKVYDEWEVKNVSFDFRLPGFLISAYCKKGLLEKAESILQRLSKNGKEPDASTWAHMAFGYKEEKQMDKAVEALTKTILASEPGLKPYFSVLDSCLKYLKEKGDLDRIEHIKSLLEKQDNGCAYTIKRLIKNSTEEKTSNLKAIDPTESGEHALEEEILEGIGTKGGKSTLIRASETDSPRTLATMPSKKETILYSRLLRASNRKSAVATTLDQWIKEGRSIEIEELREIIKKFRKFRRIKNALKVLYLCLANIYRCNEYVDYKVHAFSS